MVPRTISTIFRNLFAAKGASLGKRRLHAGVVFAFDLLVIGLSTVSLIGSTLNAFLYFRF